MNKPKAVKVKSIMEASFPEVDIATEIEVCEYLLKHNHAVLVKEEGKIVGIVTPYDLGGIRTD
ncbi:hypothetical protein H0N98_01010 [Candidatus Micrarchaeota archaeon]|nr:hypothetical protein [Candidatus Micrarchaeota archaeon]